MSLRAGMYPLDFPHYETGNAYRVFSDENKGFGYKYRASCLTLLQSELEDDLPGKSFKRTAMNNLTRPRPIRFGHEDSVDDIRSCAENMRLLCEQITDCLYKKSTVSLQALDKLFHHYTDENAAQIASPMTFFAFMIYEWHTYFFRIYDDDYSYKEHFMHSVYT